MNYATIKTHDVANGPGVRVSLFVSGCPHRCPGCFNAEAWDFDYGEVYTAEVEERILRALAPDYIKGLSLLGGEPMAPQNRAVLAPLVERVRATYPNKTIWCYTGYTLDGELLSEQTEDKESLYRMLRCLDVLVDGRFVEAQKSARLRFRGSANQRLLDVPATLAAGNPVLWEDASTHG